MPEYITIHQWLPLKKETRNKLQDIFYIKSTGMIEVVTDEFGKGTIKQDGFTNVDLQVITAEKLIEFLGSAAINETIYDLWKRAVEKIENSVPDMIMVHKDIKGVAQEVVSKVMNTADNQLTCDKCPFSTGNAKGLKIHKAKHNRIKVA